MVGTSSGGASETVNFSADPNGDFNILPAPGGFIRNGRAGSGIQLLSSGGNFTQITNSASTFRSVVFPDAAGNVVLDAATQTLTNKTLTSPSITTPTTTSPVINTGISQGSGVKHQRFGSTCTTGASVGAACNTTYSWTNPFADANYTIVCTGDNRSGTSSGVATVANVNTISGSNFNVSIAALTAVAANFTAVDCYGFHD